MKIIIINTNMNEIIETQFEKEFNIEPGTTLEPYVKTEISLINHEDYDDKDKEIETQFEEIYQKAIDCFDYQTDMLEQIDGKYIARTSEVAVLYLNAALSAANAKKDLKLNKDKLTLKKSEGNGPRVVNNNLVINTTDLLKTFLNKEKDITPK